MAKKTKATSIEEIFEMGHHIELRYTAKRMDIDGKRDWYGRYCWKIIIQGERDLECEWEGFATAKECIADLLVKANELLMP